MQHQNIIEFREVCTGGCRRKRRGIAVGDYLAVANTTPSYLPNDGCYSIFNLLNGKPLISLKLASLEDALQLAIMLNNLLKDYIIISQEYPDLDLVTLTQWSIPNGLIWEKALKSLTGVVNLAQIQRAWETACVELAK